MRRDKRSLVNWMGGIIAILSVLGLQSTEITVERNEAVPDFPESIRFEISVSSDTVIETIDLEYGTDAVVCGEGVTRVIPEDFTPGNSVEIEWEWDLRRTGALPPGTNVWWRWNVSDSAGKNIVTPKQTLRFEDESITWQTLETDDLLLYWHSGSTSFAQALMDAGVIALEDLREATGVDIDEQIEIYIYASSEELHSATLFAPAWSGGLAFAAHRAVLIGIPTASLEWGKDAFAHELSHVVIGSYTFSCISSLPRWLNEGLAMYAEGKMRSHYASLLAAAIKDDTLFSVRELGQIFSNDPDLASLSYAQSLSLVEYLIENHGQEDMLLLLDEFREGSPEDRALMDVYGVDRIGLEAAWRDWIGAAAMQDGVEAGATPTRTPFSTIAPFVGPVVVTETPSPPLPTDTSTPLSTSTNVPNGQQETEKQTGNTSPFAVVAGFFTILLLVLLAWFFRQRRKEKV